MKLNIYITVNEYANDGYSFHVVDAEADYLKDRKDYIFVESVTFNFEKISDRLSTIADKYYEEMVQHASVEHTRLIMKAKEFQSKFLLLSKPTPQE